MPWEFETDPEYQELLDWADDFMREEVEPLEFVVKNPYDMADPVRNELIKPLQARVREKGLWACHLGPELGGPGYGQVKLALLNEVIGRTLAGPVVFGCQAPDSGNSEILAHYGTEEHKKRYLQPLLDNEIVSAFSMTEPQGGSDPKVFTTRAVQEDGSWVINGEKWFTSNARFAAFFIVMAITDPDAPPYRRFSMFIVPSDTPGIEIIRNVGHPLDPWGEGVEAYIRYDDVRVPAENMLGGRGDAFVVAQTRLGGGRIHYAMRTVAMARRMLDMMAERAVSRFTQGEPLANKQLVQAMITDSWTEIEQFRLLTLRTAWKIDRLNDYKKVRVDISAIKALAPKVLHDVTARALQVHGSLGLTNEMPFFEMLQTSFLLGLGDGPTEVHKVTAARELLKAYTPSPDLFPTGHYVRRRQEAAARYADVLARHSGARSAAASAS